MKINYIAVFLGAVISIFLGFIWFGILFRNFLDNLSGDLGKPKPTPKIMAKSMSLGFLSTLLNAAFFAFCVEVWRLIFVANLSPVLIVPIFWLGVSIPFQMEKVAWEFKSWTVVVVHSLFELIRLIILWLIFWNWV